MSSVVVVTDGLLFVVHGSAVTAPTSGTELLLGDALPITAQIVGDVHIDAATAMTFAVEHRNSNNTGTIDETRAQTTKEALSIDVPFAFDVTQDEIIRVINLATGAVGDVYQVSMKALILGR